jgi:hypothetical protein
VIPVSIRYGQSWRTGPGRRAWVSAPLWLWLLAWLVILPFLIAWLAVKLTVAAVLGVVWLLIAAARGVVWLAARIHEAPAVPPRLKTPPGRR